MKAREPLQDLLAGIDRLIPSVHPGKNGKKAFRQMQFFFSFTGIAAVAAALYISINTRTFLGEAARAEGTVVELQSSRDSRPGARSMHSGDTDGYRPVVVFSTPEGEKIRFISSASSNPPMYDRGEKVTVVYAPHNPHDARISSFFSLWGIPLTLGSLGGLFLLAGAAFVIFPMQKERREQQLRKRGIPLKTEFQRVERHISLKINGTRPYQIMTLHQHPLTSETREFRSHYLLFDPTPHLKRKDITVFVDKNDPGKYLVDLSFLPEP